MLFPLDKPQHTDTPMMAQYKAIKAAHPDCLLFYRMGDFYELFFDDALIASKILDITLTRRGKNDGQDIPMCGVPFHSCDPYIAKLIKAGQRVAICEQSETPEEAKKRGGYKALVKRDVVRIITAGTLTEDHLLNAKANNFLASVAELNQNTAVAWCDVSTGMLRVQSLEAQQLPALLASITPSEILISDKFSNDVLSEFSNAILPLPHLLFDAQDAQRTLSKHYNMEDISSLGELNRAEMMAIAVILNYISRTQKSDHIPLARPEKIVTQDVMVIDTATQKSLELTRSQNFERSGSLLSAIDRTLTTSGARLLQSHLSAPLLDTNKITSRLNNIESFVTSKNLRDAVVEHLKTAPDMERSLMRLSMNRGGPRDLSVLRDGLSVCIHLKNILIESNQKNFNTLISNLTLTPAQRELIDILKNMLSETLPMLARDGGFVKTGFSAQLDELKNLRDNSRQRIASLQSRYIVETGIDSLKIIHNNILGFFIEVPSKRADRLMVAANNNENSHPFIHRQTMANAVRFTTPELAELERDVSSAAEKTLAVELEIFEKYRAHAVTLQSDILRCAQAIAELDVSSSLACLAVEQNYTRPQIDTSNNFEIIQGRHPVVEQALQINAQDFHRNDCNLSNDQRLWLLTGPNMAGKSTFLRQNAVITILAQMGSFVPAASAHIGVVDKIFSRVGAADDLARGRSTFMVEMVETATILNQATKNSLVILDEIGRGTSTYDGLSIAWACLEHLHNVTQCRGLFATHYHELTVLQSQLNHLACYTMQVKEWDNKIIFLHTVAKGTADRSYGIHVAQLAGIPSSVTSRAQELLSQLECQKTDVTLSPAPMQERHNSKVSKVEELLKSIDPDQLSPKDALDALYRLKNT